LRSRITGTLEEEQEMIRKGIEIFGSKHRLATKLGYLQRVGRGAQINRVLDGRGRLPNWRKERLEILLERAKKGEEKNL